LARERFQAGAQQLAPVPVHDNDGDFGDGLHSILVL
jgi:hypothetical protein